MKRNRRALIGKLGEEVATRYLCAHGYQVITRNYRQRVGEIDIIAQAAGELVFCEVKARTSGGYGTPAEAVSVHKQYKIRQTIKHFRQENRDLAKLNYRLDVLAIMVDLFNKEAEVEHIKNAFV
ncbi:MAG: YraN family protein [Parcubacteria group bacterium]|nr:YraN family protein [Parcubacteria group bacterium]